MKVYSFSIHSDAKRDRTRTDGVVAVYIGANRSATLEAATVAVAKLRWQWEDAHVFVYRPFRNVGNTDDDYHEHHYAEAFMRRFGARLEAGEILEQHSLGEWWKDPESACAKCGALITASAMYGPWHPANECPKEKH